MSTVTLVGTAVGSVLLLLFLVMKARMHAFVALMLVSIAAGIFSGMPLEHIADTMQKGMGDTLGFLAIVVALGAMFGKILHEVGALDQIAAQLLKRFGQSKAHYALGIAGLICALPLFFDVAVVLLIGIVFAVARRTDGNIVKLAIPLFAGVAAAASFLLPGPVPMLLASQMKADFGWMIAIGLVAAVIGMLIAGPLYGSFISRFVNWPMPPEENEPTLTKGNLPSFGFSLALVLCPLVLVGMKTIGARLVQQQGFVRQVGDLGLWTIGSHAFVVGSSFLQSRNLLAMVHPTLRRLMEESGETVNLAVLDTSEYQAIIIDQVQCTALMRMSAPIGGKLPMHASGAGKAFLATLPDDQVTKLLHKKGMHTYTPHTLTPHNLKEGLAQIRKQGFSFDDEEHALGLRCVAACIFDEHREAFAAISISGPVSRITDDRVIELGALVIHAAKEISLAYGGVR